MVRILADGGRLTVAAQVLFEFWSVATRPVSANGLGWTVAQTRLAIDGFRTRFFVLEETPEVVDLWLLLEYWRNPDPYDKLKRALRVEVDEAAWASLYSTTSRPFNRPKTGKIAVKVINHYGDEVLKVFRTE